MLGTIQTKAPAKIILSGEHAVLYGMPALAMAVNRFALTKISWRDQNKEPGVFFVLPNLDYSQFFSWSSLCDLREKTEKKYEEFLAKKIYINEVLTSSAYLLPYAFIFFLTKLSIPQNGSFNVSVAADFPTASGMGSSAAILISVLHAIVNFFGKDDFLLQDYVALGRAAENMQHGFSSGFDLFVSLSGGYSLLKDGVMKKIDLPFFDMRLIYTGPPESTTGECVSFVKKYFSDKSLCNAFLSLTSSFSQALFESKYSEIKSCVRENHKLLCRIKVVPEKVKNFIAALEKRGLAAKISGAGSLGKEGAGMVIVFGDDNIDDLLREYNFSILPIRGEKCGVQIL